MVELPTLAAAVVAINFSKMIKVISTALAETRFRGHLRNIGIMNTPKNLLFVSLPVLLAGALTLTLSLYSATSDALPQATWTPHSLQLEVGAGQGTATTVSFLPTVDAENVDVSVVPELAPYVSVSPASFPSVLKGIQYEITVNVTALSTTPLGLYDGTIRLRQGERTLARPLPTSVEVVWPTFATEEEGLSVQYPPGWYATLSTNSVKFSNVSEVGELNEATLQTESSFRVLLRQNDNPLRLTVAQWFDETMRPLVAETLVEEQYLTVDGHDAISIVMSAIGGERVYIYMLRDTDVLEITYGLFAPDFIADYEMMVESLRWAL